MKIIRYVGLGVLVIAWIWLCSVLLSSGGVTLKNLFLTVASGIIIFVPLWRKYFSDQEKGNRK